MSEQLYCDQLLTSKIKEKTEMRSDSASDSPDRPTELSFPTTPISTTMSAHTAPKKSTSSAGKAKQKLTFQERANAMKTRVCLDSFDYYMAIVEGGVQKNNFVPDLETCDEDLRVTPMDHRGRPMETSTGTPIAYVGDSESEDDQYSPYSPTSPSYPLH
jgi:hypothetical protein